MKIDKDPKGDIRIRELYNGVLLEASDVKLGI